MKPVKLILNGKEYTKGKPAIGDWYDYLDILPKIQDKNILQDKEAGQIVLEYVAKSMKIEIDDILEYGDLQEVMTAYHRINRNILAAFEAAMGEWGNAEAPVK